MREGGGLAERPVTSCTDDRNGVGSPALRIEVFATLTQDGTPKTDSTTIDLLRQRMIEDITARKLGPASLKTRLRAYERFAAWLQRSPDTATADDIRLFQMHLADTGVGIVTRNATMTGLRFLFRVTLRRHDLAFEIYHIKEPQ